MSGPRHVTQRTFEFSSLDGAGLVGDLAMSDPVRAGAVVCHPHPQYGGDRFNAVVSALHDALPVAGIATLRFDFRAEFTDGVGERLDTLAAIDELAAVVGDAPIALVGYSFGAWVALGVDHERVTAVVAIAPPLAMMSATPVANVPTLVLTPAHDQFSPPAATEPVIADWRTRTDAHIELETVEMADHFLTGRTAEVAQRTSTWLIDHL